MSTEQINFIVDALSSNLSPRLRNAKGEFLLTKREEEVVNLVAEGLGNRQMAQLLRIKENTVKKSLLRVYEKLGVSNRVELVLYVLMHCRKSGSPAQPPAQVTLAGTESAGRGFS